MSIFEPKNLSRLGYLAASMEWILSSYFKRADAPQLSNDDIYICKKAEELFENALRVDAFIKNFPNNEFFPSNPIESANAYECVIGMMLSLHPYVSFPKNQIDITSRLRVYKGIIQNIEEQKPLLANDAESAKELQLLFGRLNEKGEAEDYAIYMGGKE